MSFFEEAKKIWDKKMAEMSTRPWSKRLQLGDLGLSHYKGFLIETYHNAGLNPQLQGYASFSIKGRPRDVVKKFFHHAISEIGHDLMALNDLEVLGVSPDSVINSQPLPETKAFFSNTVFNIQKYGAVSYLAYLFYLEYTPTQNAPQIMGMLSAKGIPKEALTFLHEHATVDFNHLKLMVTYMDEIVKTENDLAQFKIDLEDCIVLHHNMLDAAFQNGENKF